MPPPPIHLTNVRVFDESTASFTSPQQVMLKNGLIHSISANLPSQPSNVNTIEGKGHYLIPGLIDCHVHIHDKSSLYLHAQHGVTTVLDMGSRPVNLKESFRGLVGVAEFFTAGPIAIPVDASAPPRPGNPIASMVGTEEDAVRFVQKTVEEKTDFVKVVADDQSKMEIVRAIADEARKVGKMSVCHAPSVVTHQTACEAGVDVLTHAPMEDVLPQELVEQLAKSGQISVPTLVMMKGCVANKIRQGLDLQNSIESVKRLHAAGVPILAGTDSNDVGHGHGHGHGAPAEVPHGSSFAVELALLAEAGLSLVEVLTAATSRPAKYFKLEDRGVVEVGKRADLVLLGSNPLVDVAAYQKVAEVFCAGVPVKKASCHRKGPADAADAVTSS